MHYRHNFKFTSPGLEYEGGGARDRRIPPGKVDPNAMETLSWKLRWGQSVGHVYFPIYEALDTVK